MPQQQKDFLTLNIARFITHTSNLSLSDRGFILMLLFAMRDRNFSPGSAYVTSLSSLRIRAPLQPDEDILGFLERACDNRILIVEYGGLATTEIWVKISLHSDFVSCISKNK